MTRTIETINREADAAERVIVQLREDFNYHPANKMPEGYWLLCRIQYHINLTRTEHYEAAPATPAELVSLIANAQSSILCEFRRDGLRLDVPDHIQEAITILEARRLRFVREYKAELAKHHAAAAVRP